MPDREYIANNFYKGMGFHLQKSDPYVILVNEVDYNNETVHILWQRGISTQVEADMETEWHSGNTYSFEEWRRWASRENYTVSLLLKEEPDWEI
jgi:hypothetical protein